ncbi:MAG: restriction endonuclease [Pseudomonadota bacterium]|nr:restriction endonuclease [Pseudomonadota bacterium]
MDNRIVFFIRNRPQGCDAIEIAREARRSFIGYPMWRRGVDPLAAGFRDALASPLCDDTEWATIAGHIEGPWRRAYSANRNLALAAVPGSITMIPRPDRGVVYAGRVEAFEVVDRPDWGDKYLALRRENGLPVDDTVSHLGDVVQGWRVDDWVELPFPSIPAWIRKSFFGRATGGRIWPMPEFGLDPVPEIDALIRQAAPTLRPCTERDEIERRLLARVSPSTFEHMVVGLLQLAQPDLVWEHVGGSGDGGVDGLGSTTDGSVKAVLQCKWKHDGGQIAMENAPADGRKRYLAVLLAPDDLECDAGTQILDRNWVVDHLLEFPQCPWSRSLRIGAT